MSEELLYEPDRLLLVPLLGAALIAGIATISPPPARVFFVALAVALSIATIYMMIADVAEWQVGVLSR